MAKTVITQITDDLDGSNGAETISFGYRGTDYEIDLSTEHSGELRDALKNYIAHARKVGGSSRRAARGTRKLSSIDTVAVRAWARENGIDIKDRGRVPAEVVAKYRQAAGQ